ncbi:hypothetical protein BZL39_D00860 [Zygosaccharomyces parabailii]|nr:hypothetical protein BZL39_D00860 [Zygosaccharomyces parabailii]CDH10571.1 uncharacterized protein ZBAI_02357 [Zygosaccharomyces bailii ISA1307]
MVKKNTVLLSHSVCEKRNTQKAKILTPALTKESAGEVWLSYYYSHGFRESTFSSKGQWFRLKLAKCMSHVNDPATNCSKGNPTNSNENCQAPGGRKNPRCEYSCNKVSTRSAIVPADYFLIANETYKVPNMNITVKPTQCGAFDSLASFGRGTSKLKQIRELKVVESKESSAAEVSKDFLASNFEAIDAMIQAATAGNIDSRKATSPFENRTRRIRRRRKVMDKGHDRYKQAAYKVPIKEHYFKRWLNSKISPKHLHVNGSDQRSGSARMSNNSSCCANRNTRRIDLTIEQSADVPNIKTHSDQHVGNIDKQQGGSFETESVYESTGVETSCHDEAGVLMEIDDEDFNSHLALEKHSKIPILLSQLESLTPKSALLEMLTLNNKLVGDSSKAENSQEKTLSSRSKAGLQGSNVLVSPFSVETAPRSTYVDGKIDEKREDFGLESSLLPQSPQFQGSDRYPGLETGVSMRGCTGPFLTSACNTWELFNKTTKMDEPFATADEQTPNHSAHNISESFENQLKSDKRKMYKSIIPIPASKAIISPFRDDKIGYAF